MFNQMLHSDLGRRAGRVGAVILACAGSLPGQVMAADLVADAGATVIQGIAVSEVTEMNFGKLVPTTAGGVVQIDVFGNRTVISGSVDLVSSLTAQTILFVAGEPGRTYSITRSAPGIVTNGTDTMDLTIIGTNTGTVSPTGTSSLGSGGQLTVGPNQPIGTYTGTFTITINYN